MKRRLIPVLATESMTNMPTKQLLGRLLSLQQCEESAALSDRTPGEDEATGGILFKNTAEWQKAYADVKAMLATRKHVPSAAERAKRRQARGQVRSDRKSNPTVQRTGASRFAQRQVGRQRRLPPVAHPDCSADTLWNAQSP
jgi:hypothetical protein